MRGNLARSFEELHVYQRARELTNSIYALTRSGAFARDHGLADQIRRACVSIISNIAEGFERGTRSEFVQFLYIAKGSSGEVRAQLQIACDQQYLTSDEYAQLLNLCRRVTGMLSKFIEHLQQSSYKGEKVARPQRLAAQSQQIRLDSLRAAQLASMGGANRHGASIGSAKMGRASPCGAKVASSNSEDADAPADSRSAECHTPAAQPLDLSEDCG